MERVFDDGMDDGSRETKVFNLVGDLGIFDWRGISVLGRWMSERRGMA